MGFNKNIEKKWQKLEINNPQERKKSTTSLHLVLLDNYFPYFTIKHLCQAFAPALYTNIHVCNDEVCDNKHS